MSEHITAVWCKQNKWVLRLASAATHRTSRAQTTCRRGPRRSSRRAGRAATWPPYPPRPAPAPPPPAWWPGSVRRTAQRQSLSHIQNMTLLRSHTGHEGSRQPAQLNLKREREALKARQGCEARRRGGQQGWAETVHNRTERQAVSKAAAKVGDCLHTRKCTNGDRSDLAIGNMVAVDIQWGWRRQRTTAAGPLCRAP